MQPAKGRRSTPSFSAIAAGAGVGGIVVFLLILTSVVFAMLNYWTLTLDRLEVGCKSIDSWTLTIAEIAGVMFGVFDAQGAIFSFFRLRSLFASCKQLETL